MQTPITPRAGWEDEPITEPLFRGDEEHTVDIVISDPDDGEADRARKRPERRRRRS